MEELGIRISNIRMETPLIAVSGVYGLDYERLVPSRPYIGAVVTKSVTLNPRLGNPEPRIVETRAGLLNAIGLQNPGIKAFIDEELPRLRIIEVPIIASVAGSSIDEYVQCSALLSERDEIHAIELNVSCPNVERGGMEFGCDMIVLGRLVAAVRSVVCGKALIVKLTPNVTDIGPLAQAAIEGGADAISLINTLRGMAIDLVTQKPKLGNRFGGLSGIGIHPVAVYMIHQAYTACCRRAGIPIIGIGGVSNPEEAIEFILAGATCVGIGTALFRDSTVFENVAKGIQEYLKSKKKQSVTSLIGVSAPPDSVDFKGVADFLNVSETVAKSLADRGTLPGHSAGGRWVANQDELGKWYLGFSGQDWAILVSNGKLDPISIQFDLGKIVKAASLIKILQKWNKTGVADIIEHHVEPGGKTVAELKLREPKEATGLYRQFTQTDDVRLSERKSEFSKALQSFRTDISIAASCELMMASETIFISLTPNGVLQLDILRDFRELPQRDRELIRFYLGSYGQRLAQDLKQS